MSNVIDLNEAIKKNKEVNPELQARKKEAIKTLPRYRGEVESKNNIRHLPEVKPGDIFWVNMDGKPYIVAEKDGRKLTIKALDETATISTGMTIFDMNKRLVAKEPILDKNDKEAMDALGARLLEFLTKDTDDNYYLLYGRDIHYVTVFDKGWGCYGTGTPLVGEKALEIIMDALYHVGDLISMDFNTSDGEPSVEIWIRTNDSPAELLYLFPYDKGMVKLS